MTDGEALNRAIRANPSEDTPRLVYADWLEENGRQELAEFIRLQCRLDSATPEHPDYPAWIEREEELQLWLNAHERGPNPRLAGGLTIEHGPDCWNWTRRGFPRFLEYQSDADTAAKPMRALARALERAFTLLPTRWLVLRFLRIEQLSELLKHPVMGALDRITVQLGASLDEQAGNEAARLIANCHHFRELRGAALSLPLGTAGAEHLALSTHLERLEWFSCTSDSLTPAAVRALGSANWFRGLRELHIQDSLDPEAFGELCRLEPFPRLHTLHLLDHSFPVAAWQQFASSTTFPRLAEFVSRETDMSAGRMAALASARGFRPCVLDLNLCGMGDDAAEAMARAPWISSLRSLSMSRNLLTSRGVAAIAGCESLGNLQSLDLSANTIGVRGLHALSNNPCLRGLRTLVLHATDRFFTRSFTVKHFSEFLTNLDLPHLRRLDLSGHPLGTEASRLLAGEKYRNLARLELAGCKLTDAVARDLLQATSLQNLLELNLAGNRLGEGIKPLLERDVMPNLSRCNLERNPIPPAIAFRLSRRPGMMLDPPTA
jgi:uncharacterized protein (TIGR02996 family)